MSFEEEFPSLKNSFIDRECRVHSLSIMNHCLDKARVREVINKYINEKNMGTAWANPWRKQILKELGLEDEE
jgi:hypothetical protein